MKQSFLILLATGLGAMATALLAKTCGYREDFGSAIGGLVAFCLVNLVVAFSSRSRFWRGHETPKVARSEGGAVEAGFAYGVSAMAFFSFVGWFTGYVHHHGAFAGTVCGGLAGFILAVTVPANHRLEFLSAGRPYQVAIALVAMAALIAIVWVMYVHEIEIWTE